MEDSRGNSFEVGDELRSLLMPEVPGIKCVEIKENQAVFNPMEGSFVTTSIITLNQESLSDSHWLIYEGSNE